MCPHKYKYCARQVTAKVTHVPTYLSPCLPHNFGLGCPGNRRKLYIPRDSGFCSITSQLTWNLQEILLNIAQFFCLGYLHISVHLSLSEQKFPPTPFPLFALLFRCALHTCTCSSNHLGHWSASQDDTTTSRHLLAEMKHPGYSHLHKYLWAWQMSTPSSLLSFHYTSSSQSTINKDYLYIYLKHTHTHTHSQVIHLLVMRARIS